MAAYQPTQKQAAWYNFLRKECAMLKQQGIEGLNMAYVAEKWRKMKAENEAVDERKIKAEAEKKVSLEEIKNKVEAYWMRELQKP
jgi:hypothetical protein